MLSKHHFYVPASTSGPVLSCFHMILYNMWDDSSCLTSTQAQTKPLPQTQARTFNRTICTHVVDHSSQYLVVDRPSPTRFPITTIQITRPDNDTIICKPFEQLGLSSVAVPRPGQNVLFSLFWSPCVDANSARMLKEGTNTSTHAPIVD